MAGCRRCHAVHAGVLRHHPWWAFWRPDWNKAQRPWIRVRRTWHCKECGANWPKGEAPQPPPPPVDWKVREDYRNLPEEMRHHPFVFWWDAGLVKSPPCPQCGKVPSVGRFFQSQTMQAQPLYRAAVCPCGGVIAMSKAVN